MFILQRVVCSEHCRVCSVQFAVCCFHFTVSSVYGAVCHVQCAVNCFHRAVCSVLVQQFMIVNIQSALSCKRPCTRTVTQLCGGSTASSELDPGSEHYQKTS